MEAGDLEPRVSALEHQMRDVTGRVQASERDAAAARVLAGAADRDVSAIRGDLRDFRQATTASFNALRQDFVDLGSHVDQGFAQVDGRFAEVDRGFAEVDRGFAEMRGKLDAAAAGQQQIVDILQTLATQEPPEPSD